MKNENIECILKDFEQEKREMNRAFFNKRKIASSDKAFDTYSKKILRVADILHLLQDKQEVIIKSTSNRLLFEDRVERLKRDIYGKSHPLCDNKVIRLDVGSLYEIEIIVES